MLNSSKYVWENKQSWVFYYLRGQQDFEDIGLALKKEGSLFFWQPSLIVIKLLIACLSGS